MKKSFVFLFYAGLSLVSAAQSEKRITILHTNDLHSRLIGFAPESAYTSNIPGNDSTTGGFARIATIIKTEKNGNQGTTLVLDAGDFFMGTLFPSLEKETGFQLRLMKTMGYDAIGFGNHEYDFGPEWLAEVISRSGKNGEIPSLLIGNAVFNKYDKGDDALEKLCADNIISSKLVLIKEGIRIGIFSIVGKDADGVAPKARPVTFARQTAFARRMVKDLQSEKCDIIICVSHSGVEKDKNGKWSGEDVRLARAVKGINLIVGGHSHTLLDQPLTVNGTTIVQAGEFGRFVGRLSLTCSGGITMVKGYDLIPVDDRILGDSVINQQIEEQKNKISDLVLRPLGLDYNKPIAETGFCLRGNEKGGYVNSNLGPLVADAIQAYVNRHNKRGTDISMVASGVIFDRILPGVQTAADLFRVVPLGSGTDNVPGYPLSRLYVTGRELKSILEILQVAYKSSPDNYCYYSGLRVGYEPDKGLFRKIKKIEIVKSDGKTVNVDFSRSNSSLYALTANSYMLEFIGIIKKLSYGLINVVPKDYEGNKIQNMSDAVIDIDEKMIGVQEGKEWLALIEFLGLMKDTNNDGIPDLDRKYAAPVRSFYRISSR